MAIRHGAEPFLLPGGRHGILLIHGFTGSPAEMKPLGMFLQSQGHTVMAPRLTGHGTEVKDLQATQWPSWYSTTEDCFYMLSGLCDTVSVFGLSMGALLALKLASEYPVHSVGVLSAPVFLYDKRLRLLPVYRLFRRYTPQRRKCFSRVTEEFIGYDQVPLQSLTSLLALIKQMQRIYPLVTQPVFIAQSKSEHTVRPESAVYIYERLGSKEKQLFWLNKSGHIITRDHEKEALFTAIANFLATNVAEGLFD